MGKKKNRDIQPVTEKIAEFRVEPKASNLRFGGCNAQLILDVKSNLDEELIVQIYKINVPETDESIPTRASISKNGMLCVFDQLGNQMSEWNNDWTTEQKIQTLLDDWPQVKFFGTEKDFMLR